MLLSFLQLPEQAANLVSFEFLRVLTTLLGCDHEQTLVYALKASAVLSSVSTLRKAIIRNSDLMKTVAEMLVQKSSISNSLAKEAAKFISNMTLAMEEAIKFEKQLAALPPAVAAAMLAASSPMSPGGEHQSSSPHKAQHQSTVIIEKFYDDHVYDGIFAILKSTHAAVPTKSIAIHALQNIVAHTANGVKLVSKCLDPMVKFLQNQADLGAIQVLYNLSCIPQCREELVDNKIHIKALELMMLTREGAMKSAYLQILVQLSSSQVCILELLRMDLVSKLESQLKAHSIKCDVWKDISLMMLAIVAYAGDNLVEANQISIVRTLKLICSPTAMHQAATAYIQAATAATTTTTNGNNNNASNVNNLHNNNNHSNQVAKFDGNEFLTAMTTTHLDEIMENGANILKFISVSFDNFEEMDPVVRTIIAYSSDNEEIVDNISHVLYNMTCSEQNIHLMLKDITYLNVMIRIMRNGKVHIQENIAHAMRTFCSINTCVELLLKHDILSDLIVIALLRSSSEEIKTICSEAFYNMLTHEKTRLHLLQGDLWWAFMRLGRTDSEAVRSICVRALSDLATPFNPTLFLEQQEQLQLSAVDPEEYTELDKYNDTVKREEMKQQKAEMQLKCISALRSHHVLSFMKDLSTASSADMLLQCLQVVHNLLHQFADLPSTAEPLSPVVAAPATSTSSKSKNPALVAMRSALDNAPPAAAGTGAVAAVSAQENDSVYVSHEVIACIRIGADAFHRGTTLKAVRIATILLLKCAQLKVDGMESEFINIDIIEVLKSTRESWAQHPDCRLNISRMLYELSKSKIFTKSVTLADMSPILVSCFEHDISAMEICENIVAILLQFVISENIAPKDLIEMGIWPMIIRASLSGDSAIITKHNNTLLATYGGGGGGKSGNSAKASVAMLPTHLISANTNSRRSTSTHGHGAAAATGTTSNGATPPSSAPGSATGGRTRQSLYLREPGAMTNPIEAQNDGIKGPLPSIFRIQGMGLMLLAHTIDVMLEKKADVITPTLLQGLLKADIMDHVWTKHNLLVILHACSTSPACIGALLQEDTFQLLLRYVSTSIGSNRQEKALEFASTFLRNASFHTMMLSKLISIPNQAINEFVREICEYANPLIAMDLSIFFYHIANHLVNSEQYLHPKFVLEMIQKVSSQPEIAEKEYDVININKYTISMILNKYTFGHGVEPSFIQNMFAYIQSNMASYIPELMNELSFKSIPEFKCNLASDFLNVKECLSMDVLLFQGDDRLYQAILHRDVKTQETILLKFSNAFGVSYDRLEMMENVPITVFGKIIKSFDSVKDNMIGNAGHGHGHAGSAIAEEFEEEEEENDDEDGSISAQSSKHHHNNNMEEMVNEEKMPDDFLGESHASHDASLIKIDESEDKEDTGPVYSDTESERSERSERSRRSETDRTVESNASNNKKLNKQPSMIPEDQGGAMSKNNSNAVIANQSSKGQLVTASSNQSLKNTAAVSKPSNNEAAASPSSSNKSDAAPSQKVAADAAMTISELSATTATVTISKPTAALKPEANDEDDFYADDFSAKSAKSKSSRVSKSSKPMTNNKSGKAGDDEDNYSTYSFEDI